jgi:murein DD-endopeptidase MepM/ murein hydrolase activator NlpD
MVNLIDRLPLTRALRTAWRTLRLPAAAFQDIRIIVEHGGALHHYYLTAHIQRRLQRGAKGVLATLALFVLLSSAVQWQADRVLRANDVLYAELLSAAQAEGSMSAEELQALSSSDLAALLRERTGVLRGQVDAAADLLSVSNGGWLASLGELGIPLLPSAGGPTVGRPSDGRGGEDVTVTAAAGSAPGGEARISDEVARNRRLMATVRMLPQRLPLEHARLTSQYGLRRHPLTFSRNLHVGLDLVSDSSQAVHAVRPGRVIFAGRSGGYGNTVVLAHPGGIETRYAHLRRILVARGDSVAEWDQVGIVGSTGLATGPHLHYEVRLLGRALDPQRILALRQQAP